MFGRTGSVNVYAPQQSHQVFKSITLRVRKYWFLGLIVWTEIWKGSLNLLYRVVGDPNCRRKEPHIPT